MKHLAIIDSASMVKYDNTTSGLTSVNTQAAIDELASNGGSVTYEGSTSNIKMDGTVSVGSLSTVARADHVHPSDTSRALSTHTHGTYDNSTTLSGANVYSNISITDGIVTGLTTRALSASDVGASATSHTHSTYLPLTGGTVTGNIVAKTITFAQTNNGNSGTAKTIDWSISLKHLSTLTNNCTYTFVAPESPCNLVLLVKQDGTGSRKVTWPSSVKWSGGVAPTLTLTANRTDIISFYYDGTYYYGFPALNF